MSVKEQTIEADVVEIDGMAVEPGVSQKKENRADAAKSDRNWGNWQTWSGRVKRLDARFWPLWLALGFLLLVFFVAIAMVTAVLFISYWVCKSLLLSFASLFESSYELQRK